MSQHGHLPYVVRAAAKTLQVNYAARAAGVKKHMTPKEVCVIQATGDVCNTVVSGCLSRSKLVLQNIAHLHILLADSSCSTGQDPAE